MTEEQAQKIKEIYDKAIAELDELGRQKQQIIKKYIKELEEQKIETLRKTLSITSNETTNT